MRALLLSLLSALLLSSSTLAAHDPVVLVKDGKPAATIVVPAEHDHLDFAVAELNRYLEQATGARLPVVTDEAKQPQGNLLLLGESTATLALGLKEAELPSEGFVIKTFPGKVAIVGDTTHLIDGWYKQPTEGNLWGVYELLERFLGVRWYIPGPLGTIVPETDTAAIPETDLRDHPDFPIRTWYADVNVWPRYSRFKIDLDLEGREGKLFSKRSRDYNAYGGVQANHSMGYVPRLHHDKPEFFALKSDGKRALYPPNPDAKRRHGRHWRGYLDYTSDALLEQVIEDHKAYIEGTLPEERLKLWHAVNPSRAPNDFRIAFLPNDGLILSQSEAAKKLYGTSYPERRNGYASEYIYKFAHDFAWAMYREFPKMKFVTTAYSTYTLPPKTVGKFPPSFIVQIAVMQPIAMWKEPKIYEEWSGHVRRWHELTGNKVHFWQYACWPKLLNVPFFWPGLWQTFYKDHGDYALGAFVNGGPPGGNVALHHLNYYFGRKVLWDKDYDIDAGLRDYARTMYGPAHEPMYEFLKLVRQRWESVVWDMPISQRVPTTEMLYGEEGTYPPEVIDRLQTLLEKAAATEGLSKIERRRMQMMVDGYAFFFDEAARMQKGLAPYNYGFELTAEPTIDGKADDEAWRGVPWLSMDRHMATGEVLEVGSRIKVGWRNDALYLMIENDEPNIEKLKAEAANMGRVYNDDCIEIYLDPEASRADSLHLIYNSKGNWFFNRRVEGFNDRQWRPTGSEAATKVLKDRWTLELKLPFKGLLVEGRPPMRWVWNVFRNRKAAGNHYIALAPTWQRSTKSMSNYPELMLVSRPVLMEQFVESKISTHGARSWHREQRKTVQFDNAVTRIDGDGRRAFTINTNVIPRDTRQWHRTMATGLWSKRWMKIPIEKTTAADFRLRWDKGVPATVTMAGNVTPAGGGESRYFKVTVFKGESPGEWITGLKTLVGTPLHKTDRTIQPGDTLTRLAIGIEVPTDKPVTGQVDYAIVGEETAAGLK